jgi:TrmH RNA methyltransferase
MNDVEPDEPVRTPKHEAKITGINAVLAAFGVNPDDIIRVYVTDEVARLHFGPLMRYCADHRLAYHVVSDTELDRIAGGVFHEGVCVIRRQRPILDAAAAAATALDRKAHGVVLVENLHNPHHLGALLRSCAHFGVSLVMLSRSEGSAAALRAAEMLNSPLSAAAVRSAEGAAERVRVAVLRSARETSLVLDAYRSSGWPLLALRCGTGSTADNGPQTEDWSRFTPPYRALLVLGSDAGPSRALVAAVGRVAAIPGAESGSPGLGLPHVASVALADMWRARISARATAAVSTPTVGGSSKSPLAGTVRERNKRR